MTETQLLKFQIVGLTKLMLTSLNTKKSTNFLLKTMINSGPKKEKELVGSKNIQKLKTLNIVKMM